MRIKYHKSRKSAGTWSSKGLQLFPNFKVFSTGIFVKMLAPELLNLKSYCRCSNEIPQNTIITSNMRRFVCTGAGTVPTKSTDSVLLSGVQRLQLEEMKNKNSRTGAEFLTEL